jgi:D-glycero-alpha-D-manno-heptose-7-phosphate kinase
MIISRTPLRMSFVGGGSDLPAFYRRYGGAVISTAIDKYVYVTLNKKFDDGLRIAYSRNEEVDHLDAVEHPIVRNALKLLGIPGGIEITTIADVPSRGTGLGSSSAFTVGLLIAASAHKGSYMSADELGRRASHVEIEMCGEPIGKQDQYASAFGGFSLIEFHEDDSVQVTPVIMSPDLKGRLEQRLLMFYTGTVRSASAILKDQGAAVESDSAKRETLRSMVRLAHRMRADLEHGDLESFGSTLHENWLLKKSLTGGITSGVIDQAYDAAMAAGATGGKLLGAGGGGFLVFDADPARHDAIRAALQPLREIPFRFEPLGSRVIFYNP